MKWSWNIGTFAGIKVYMHATFPLLLGWISVTHWVQVHALLPVLLGSGFILAVFLCVVLHEYGHALTARRFGIATKDITLLPIGGVGRLERIPNKPNQELWVALAGPAVNIAIAAGLSFYLLLTDQFEPVQQIGLTHGMFLERILFANVFLAGFNLIPGFPMDGGRILRALLAKHMKYARATLIAATIGQASAIALGFIGLFTNPLLVFVALFVWIGAAQEVSFVQANSLLESVMFVLGGWQQDFPVVDRGQVVGMLLRADMIATLTNGGVRARVDKTMRRDFPIASPEERLDSVFNRLHETEVASVPIVNEGELLGLVTFGNVPEISPGRSDIRCELPSR
jgi:Zn-dependent protease